MSAGTTLYLLLEQNTEVSTRDVRLSDVAKMACTDEHALNRLKTIKLFRIPSGKKFRKTMTVVDIIEKVQALYPNMEVNNLGETDFIVTYVEQGKEHPVWDFVKTVLISAVIFFGSAFSIMAFNNDINVTELFAQVYEQCTGAVSDGYTILEISYSLGLSVGIILFFNHFAEKDHYGSDAAGGADEAVRAGRQHGDHPGKQPKGERSGPWDGRFCWRLADSVPGQWWRAASLP